MKMAEKKLLGTSLSLLTLATILIAIIMIAGCSSTATMLQNASLKTRVVMTEPLFLDNSKTPKTVYVQVTNTSDLKGVMLEPVLRDRLMKKGMTIVEKSDDATWIVNANITSFVYHDPKTSMGKEMSLAGTVTAGIAGAALAGNNSTALPAAIAGAIIGNVGGALLGNMISVDSVSGKVDLQIKEKTDKPIKGIIRSDTKQGTSTATTTTQEIELDRMTYRTNFMVEARRTNMNLEEAVAEVTNKLADQISGVF
jgi:outer membrane lipoprotein SlyB